MLYRTPSAAFLTDKRKISVCWNVCVMFAKESKGGKGTRNTNMNFAVRRVLFPLRFVVRGSLFLCNASELGDRVRLFRVECRH